jgi:hypothetical protein
MVFDANITAALRCKSCGRLIVEDISFFELKGQNGGIIKCQCGETILSIKSKNLKTFHVFIPCLACEREHSFILKWESIPFRKLKILTCPVTSHDVAFIGSGYLVRSMAARQERGIIELMNSI